MTKAKLVLEPWCEQDGELVVAASLDDPQGCRHRLWWRLPASWRAALTPWADPFVVAFVIPMMQWRRDVLVEGAVSPSLLANLEQYMAIWHAWQPKRYQPVEIHACDETEAPPPAEPGQAITPLSCGIDSSFTLYRHHQRRAGRRSRHIAAAMVMHGFDIWLDQANARGMYDGLLAGARAMVRSLKVPCLPVTSNFHELPTVWGDSFGSHLVGGLRLLAGRCDTALFPNDLPYSWAAGPWGSHPVSNPFLGSRHFPVIDDGGEATRCEKVRVLAQWPEAMHHLRVCFHNPGSHANCCRCEKCIRTILSFRAAGVGLPPAFSRDVTDRQIRGTRFHYEHNVRQWQEIIRGAEPTGLGRSGWVQAVHAAIRRHRRRWWWRQIKQTLRSSCRVLRPRGAALSAGD